MRTFLVSIALAAAFALPAATPASAAKPGTFAGTLGTPVPAGAKVRMRAIDRRTGVAVESVAVSRKGAFKLALPAGTYLVVATTVAKNGKVTLSKVGISLKAGQKRVGSTLDRRKNRRVKKATKSLTSARQSMYRQERGQVSAGNVAVEIPDFTGTSSDPEWNTVRRGLNDVITTDVLTGTEKCPDSVSVIEVDRRADIVKELEFQQSRYVDPSTRVVRNFIIGDVEVRGTTRDVPGSPGAGEVTVRIVDKASGEELGTITKTVNPNTFFEDMESLGKSLANELCNLSDVYEVKVDMTGTGVFATHNGSATLRTTIKARRGSGAESTVWRGAATTVWENPTFVSKIGCSYVDPVSSPLDLSAEIQLASPDTLRVTWTLDNGGSVATNVLASIVCPEAPPIPGQPGPSLVGAVPFTFVVPVAGGVATVPNGFNDGVHGFFNTGTITVTPKGVARKR